jgi:hypothetical protein
MICDLFFRKPALATPFSPLAGSSELAVTINVGLVSQPGVTSTSPAQRKAVQAQVATTASAKAA